MSRRCTICESKARAEIDRFLLEMPISGTTLRGIARRFKVSEDSISRHKKNCLSEPEGDVLQAMRTAREKALQEIEATELADIKDKVAGTISSRLEQAADFFGQLKILRERAGNLLDQAEQAEDLRSAGTFLKELREQIRLLAELEGKLPQAQVNILLNPEWIELRTLIANAVEPYPEVREAVISAIRGR